MFSFLLCVVALVLGYIFYGKFVDRVIGPDPSRLTPAFTKTDGLDYVPMPTWKAYMIQFLNIAGTGPIFGAIMGAKFGPSAYLWIVLGSIFAGAVHDYLAGMVSLRQGGASLPEIIGRYNGRVVKDVMLVFTVFLLILVGGVFVYSPAIILGDMIDGGSVTTVMICCAVIFVYYIIATLLPVDKIIGKIYPLFAVALIFMAVAMMICLVVKWPSIPEFWDGLANRGPSVGVNGQPIFPCLFITIACGAVSGFHATQSPMMARCMKNETLGRPIFYGAMITEGIVALIWAAVASYFFFDGGAADVDSSISASAPEVVTAISKSWLGIFGSFLALLGVVAAPITSGDTALRSARMIVADFLHLDQSKRRNRLLICIPLFVVVAFVLWLNIADDDGFNTIWRYFAWANQSLSIFTFWALATFLAKHRKGMRYLIAEIPGMFMTMVCVGYICNAHIGFGLPVVTSACIGAAVAVLISSVFYFLVLKKRPADPEPELVD